MEYIKNNIGSITVLFIVISLVVIVVRVMIQDKKNGKSSCGACSGCPSAGRCNSYKTMTIQKSHLPLEDKEEK